MGAKLHYGTYFPACHEDIFSFLFIGAICCFLALKCSIFHSFLFGEAAFSQYLLFSSLCRAFSSTPLPFSTFLPLPSKVSANSLCTIFVFCLDFLVLRLPSRLSFRASL